MKNNFSISYQYRTIRKGDEIIFQELNDLRNQIATNWILKISKLRHKEIFKKLTLTELNNLKTLIEEIISEKNQQI
jgi:hypothetical protein|nr:MAG TPA: hypothetical protein [Caudoviricetes sp.]